MQGNQPRPAQASPNQSELAHNDLNQSKPIRTVQASPSTAPYLPEPALAAAQNSPKWPQMAQNGPKWPKMAQIGPETAQISLKPPQTARNCLRQARTAPPRRDALSWLLFCVCCSICRPFHYCVQALSRKRSRRLLQPLPSRCSGQQLPTCIVAPGMQSGTSCPGAGTRKAAGRFWLTWRGVWPAAPRQSC